MSKGSIYKILTSNMPDGWHRVKVGKSILIVIIKIIERLFIFGNMMRCIEPH